MSHRWFIVPMATNDGRYPKYTDRDGLTGFSGKIVDFRSETWADTPYPFIGEQRYIVNVFGEDAVLDAIANEPDAHTMATLGLRRVEVAGILNQRLGQERSFNEWVSEFRVD